MKRLSTSALILLLAIISVAAQDNAQKRHQWMREMQKAKQEFMAKELNLTEHQNEQLKAIVAAMENELGKLRRDTRTMEKAVESKTDASDLEYEKAAEAMFEHKGKEAEIEMRYYHQLAKILTPRQLFLYKKAEMKWMKTLMKHRRK